jgi:RimJ/RimL family protein N-acetyltransferase
VGAGTDDTVGGPPAVELTDGRLLLRPWRPDDADWVDAVCQDPEIQRWTRIPVPYTRVDAEWFVTEFASRAWERGEEFHFAVVDVASGQGLGSVALVLVPGAPGVGEVGYYTAPAARGRGVAADSVGLLVDWAFDVVGLVRLELHIDPRNTGSLAVARRCAFELEGVLRSRTEHRGERRDVAIHARLRP